MFSWRVSEQKNETYVKAFELVSLESVGMSLGLLDNLGL
jgi:hypothetical protein